MEVMGEVEQPNEKPSQSLLSKAKSSLLYI